ncbi:hypothetical protein [Pseudomonas sp. H1h]|uniref:hypothetical protein n=1 Tax=Pseudomonas sp. H1h TaxID=1397280 RepID=UPI00046A8EB9|nr:hypothetical protein [Pseudomonas sp. H1h]
MIKIKKKITNPMTVIVIFAFISESSAAISLPFLGSNEREIYVWFLISFPFYLLLLFFVTLNFNYRSLYAPSDFNKDDSFLKIVDELKSIRSSAYSPDPPWIEHSIRLPKRIGTLRTIDIRPMSSAQAFKNMAEHFPRPDKQSAEAVLLLTDPASDILFRQITLSLLKQSKKGTGGAIIIAHNVNTLSTVILGEA